jgi:ABC-type transporter Mla maintaining outer membrane lipid asymmetry permease subunit MlaE
LSLTDGLKKMKIATYTLLKRSGAKVISVQGVAAQNFIKVGPIITGAVRHAGMVKA